MKHHRQLAAALACALAIGLGAGAVLATESTQPNTTPPILIAPNPNASHTVTETAPSADAALENTLSQEDATGEAAPVPDAEGTISFPNLADRVRKGNLTYLMLEEHISQAEATDYEEIKEQLREDMNTIANAQYALLTGSSNIATGMPMLDFALQGMYDASTSSTLQTLKSTYDAMREQYDMLRDGEIQADAADGIRQLRNTQNTIIKGAEALYAAYLTAQIQGASLERTLALLDRTIQELDIRYEMGQISALTLQQTRAKRTQVISGLQSLNVGLQNLSLRLEDMVGEPLTGTLQPAPLAPVTDVQLAAMDLETDLAAAKATSYDLYIAQKTLDDAKEVFDEAGEDNGHNPEKTEYRQAQHAWQAAQYTYEATVQGFDLSFRILFASVRDYAQVLTAAQTALALEEANYAADLLRYEQGVISNNTLLATEDNLNAARDTVTGAQLDLFTAYNNYRWAVEYGIVN